MHWDIAPENPGRLDAAGVPIALTSHGLRDQATFLTAVRRAVERGLKPDSALKALTTKPAELLGMGDRLGKLAPGMLGNLVITDGDLFDKKTKVIETWVDGERFEIEKQPIVDVRGTWQIEVTAKDDRVLRTVSKPGGADEKAEETRLSQVSLIDNQLSFRLDGKSLGKEGPARVSATVSQGPDDKQTLLGTIVWADGASEKLNGRAHSETISRGTESGGTEGSKGNEGEG
jgi:hypothetical protein